MELLNSKVVQTIVKHLNNERLLLEGTIAKKEGLVEVLSSITQVAVVASTQSKENDKLDVVIEQKRKILDAAERQIKATEKAGEDKVLVINNEIKTLKAVHSKTKNDMDADEKKAMEQSVSKIEGGRKHADGKINEYSILEAEAKARKDKAVKECNQVEKMRKALKEEIARI